MAKYIEQMWRPGAIDGQPRRFLRRGVYQAFIPDRVTELPPPRSEDIDLYPDASVAVATAAAHAGRVDLGSISNVLTRSEAVASSFIEGLQVSAKNVALANFTGYGTQTALAVSRNVKAMQDATKELVEADRITIDHLEKIQRQLLPHVAGLRREPVWIGGGGANPFNATYVAPPAEYVRPLLEDLLDYINEPHDSPLVATATAHAAFETIHPFGDGNGRVGRALIHTMLARSGLVPETVMPISQVLAERKGEYYDALQEWRQVGDRDPRSAWLQMFAQASLQAAQMATDMADEVSRMKNQHRASIDRYREEQGMRALRSDSVINQILADSTAHPVMTTAIASERYSVSEQAAYNALEMLSDAGVLSTKKLGRGKTTAYINDGVFALSHVVPSLSRPEEDDEPEHTRLPSPSAADMKRVRQNNTCGYYLPLAKRHCVLAPNHPGQHR